MGGLLIRIRKEDADLVPGDKKAELKPVPEVETELSGLED